MFFDLEGDDTKSIQISMITNPPLIPNKKIYYINGFIKKKIGSSYLNEIDIGNNKFYFTFNNKIETNRGKENILNIRLNEGVSVIGRFVGLRSYTTIIGEEKQMPIYD